MRTIYRMSGWLTALALAGGAVPGALSAAWAIETGQLRCKIRPKKAAPAPIPTPTPTPTATPAPAPTATPTATPTNPQPPARI